MAHYTGRLGTWSYVRAATITLVLLSQCVSALPDKPLTAAKLARPEGQRALRWLSVLSRADDAESSIQAQIIQWSERSVAARKWLLEPLGPVLHGAALRQSWNLFLTVGTETFRIRIDVLEADAWRMVYRANDRDTLGLQPLLGYRRVRSLYHPNKRNVRAEYAAWTHWLAQRVFSDHPAISALRVSQERLQIGERGEPARVIDTQYAYEHTRTERP